MTIDAYYFHTCSTGLAAIGPGGSSSAVEFSMSLAPVTIESFGVRDTL